MPSGSCVSEDNIQSIARPLSWAEHLVGADKEIPLQ